MKLCRDGKISLGCFIIAAIIVGLPELLLSLKFTYFRDIFDNIWFIHVFQYSLLNLLVLLAFKGFLYQVSKLYLVNMCILLVDIIDRT